MVKWLTLHIQEALGSNLGWETGYPDSDFSWFFTVPPGKYEDSALNYAMTTSFHILSNSSFTYHHFI
jgi:hypothetical protein